MATGCPDCGEELEVEFSLSYAAVSATDATTKTVFVDFGAVELEVDSVTCTECEFIADAYRWHVESA